MAAMNSQVALFLVISLMLFSCISFSFSLGLPCPPKSPSAPSKPSKCPKDTLKLGVCGSWLGLVYENIGTKPSEPCCTVISGLADLEAALCLCTAIKAKVLGAVKLDVPVAVSLLVNACEKKVPQGFICP